MYTGISVSNVNVFEAVFSKHYTPKWDLNDLNPSTSTILVPTKKGKLVAVNSYCFNIKLIEMFSSSTPTFCKFNKIIKIKITSKPKTIL